jgi:mutator protein MutT
MIVVAAIIIHKNRLLLAERLSSAGSWEFPGGKVEEKERPEQALKREIKEELGLEIQVGPQLGSVSLGDKDDDRLLGFMATIEGGQLRLNAHKQILWVRPERLNKFNLLAADKKLLSQVNLEKLLKDASANQKEIGKTYG